MFHSFGAEPPSDTTTGRKAALWVLALLFVATSVVILVVLNAFSLLIGVSVSFLGRNETRFRFHQLFGRLPLIGVTLPVLLGFAIWHNAELSGTAIMIWPALLVIVAAAVFLAAVIAFNNLVDGRGRR